MDEREEGCDYCRNAIVFGKVKCRQCGRVIERPVNLCEVQHAAGLRFWREASEGVATSVPPAWASPSVVTTAEARFDYDFPCQREGCAGRVSGSVVVHARQDGSAIAQGLPCNTCGATYTVERRSS